MNYKIISTGSQGNAVVINESILIDCGVGFKALGNVYRQLKMVLLTHEHVDHFNGRTLKRLAQERPTLRFGCCRWLVEKLAAAGVPKEKIDLYEIGKLYDYHSFQVSPVKLYHNVENCGYRLFIGKEKAIYMTDTGHLKGIAAKDYDLYMIESNYEEEKLKQRIAKKTAAGQYCYEFQVPERHLSHEQASEWLLQNMQQSTGEYVFLHQHRERKEAEQWT